MRTGLKLDFNNGSIILKLLLEIVGHPQPSGVPFG